MSERSPEIPRRDARAHKGRSGAVLVIAGSRRFAGAAQLATLGAGKSGAGLITLAAPVSLGPRLHGISPAVMFAGQRETWSGELASSSLAALLALARDARAVVLGPGLGRSEDLRGLVARLLVEIDCPMVVDADALHALAELDRPELVREHPRVLTPHPGEAARLLGWTVDQIEEDREASVRALQVRYRSVVVLKGPATLVAGEDGLHRNTSGSAVLATGGMGDVLAGVVGALLAAGQAPFEAACAGVYVHGRAGDLATRDLSCDRGLLPEELTAFLPQAIGEILR